MSRQLEDPLDVAGNVPGVQTDAPDPAHLLAGSHATSMRRHISSAAECDADREMSWVSRPVARTSLTATAVEIHDEPVRPPSPQTRTGMAPGHRHWHATCGWR